MYDSYAGMPVRYGIALLALLGNKVYGLALAGNKVHGKDLQASLVTASNAILPFTKTIISPA